MIREECIYLETPILGATSYVHIFHKANTVTCCVNEAIFRYYPLYLFHQSNRMYFYELKAEQSHLSWSWDSSVDSLGRSFPFIHNLCGKFWHFNCSDSVISLVVSPTYQLLPPWISSPEIVSHVLIETGRLSTILLLLWGTQIIIRWKLFLTMSFPREQLASLDSRWFILLYLRFYLVKFVMSSHDFNNL